MLVIDELSVRVAGRLLIDRACAHIPTGARVGLVGRNGCGKSTLFRAIVGEIAPEHGAVRLSPRCRIGRLAQEAPDGPESLIDVVLRADQERLRLLAEAQAATDPQRIADIQIRLADIGAHAAPARAAEILAGLGFSAADQTRSCAEFSGGWRMRVALAATLFAEPDLLLLDEPTNFLDLESTLWLQKQIAAYPHTVVVISHDRDLLDQAVDWTLHLDGGTLTLYRGGYSAFERQRRERQALDLKLARKQEEQRRRLTAFVERFRAKATKARQAQSRLKRLAKLEPVAAIASEQVRPIVFPPPAKPLAPPLVALERVAVGYAADRPVLRHLDLRIDPDDRIALIGANGNGKSTLVKLLAGRLPPMSGRFKRAERLAVGYFAQHQLDELDGDAGTYAHLRRLMPDAPEATVRARAGAIGFSEAAADTPSAALSGGEKARVLLGLATLGAPHLIVLDEPTNHLDIDSRAALLEAINDYAGAVILVSHDRYLIDACADRLWLVADGTVTPFDGDLDDYRRLVLAERRDQRARERQPKAPSRGDARRAAAQLRIELAPLRRAIAEAEASVARWNEAIARIDAALADAALFARDPAAAARLAKERAQAVSALERAEDDWLTASESLEAATR
ncbi:MAG: ABC-F family ATP-binding cassette domain-containing protein [Hyphomicrobiales bacterium]|nr:ABC-F family ATP-binding cassette domain-containing protein [Hyphomicrobiales bacterium]